MITKLAVVIPALNEENLIVNTLESLNAQSNNDFTLILVDNGSSDNTIKVVEDYSKKAKYQIITLEEKRTGVGYARDTGMQKALELGALYLAGTDADTIVPDNWVASIYEGFKNSQADLLCGECDPSKILEIKHAIAELTLNVRSVLFRQVKPYVRGANFAITAGMFSKIGGVKQPLTKEGKPAPGEDIQLELDVLRLRGAVSGSLATVKPHPRRYISTLLNFSSFKGGVHEGGVVTQVREEEKLKEMLATIPASLIEEFANKLTVALFDESIVNVFKEPLFREIYWKNALAMLKPFSQSEIEQDMEAQDIKFLWGKYNQAFLKNIRAFI